MARLNLPTRSWIAASAAILATSVLALTGCTSSTDSITITYQTDGGTRTTSFTPHRVNCDDDGPYGGSFPDKPYNFYSIMSFSGRSAVNVWVYQDKLIYIDSDDATVSTAEHPDGSVEYHATAEGQVAVTDLKDPDAPPSEPPLDDADWYDGTVEARITCPPAP